MSLLSAPATFTNLSQSGLNANGCGAGGGGFFCLQSTGNGVPVASAGDIYSFLFQATLVDSNSLLLGADQASVKALYVTAAGKQNGLTSEPITLSPSTSPVPEPSSFALLGTGRIGLAVGSCRLLA